MVLETQPGFFIGPLFIYYYGIVYAVTALSLYFVLYTKRKKLGLIESQVDTFVISALVGLLVGGRIFHFLINDPKIFIKNPIQLFLIRQGGMSFFGAVVGVMSGTWLWYKRNSRKIAHHKNNKDTKLKTQINLNTFLQMLDYSSIVVGTALIFGRIANFLNQELVGRVADPSIVTWCVNFATSAGCRHPYQLYAAASHVVLAIIVLIVLIKSKKAGTTIATFFLIYGISRFITDFWRDDPIVLFGLTIWQFFAIVIALVGGYLLWKLHTQDSHKQKD